jgi:bla regulator protein blaR1
LSRAGVFAAFAAAILICLVNAKTSRAQSSAQNAAATAPVFEYEVASIKPYKPAPGDPPGMIRMGIMTPADGLNATGVTVRDLVQMAYGVQPYQVTGGPDWFGSERLEIDAKMESSVADALAKLSQDDKTLVRQKMLQALLADRFQLTIHRETKELPTYTLTIGKNGSKLVEAKPEDIPAAAPPQGGRGGRVGMFMSAGAGGTTLSGKAMTLANLVRTLSGSLRSPILDKTGLTGKYDITLKWMPENFGAGAAPGFAPPPAGAAPNAALPPDPGADSVGPTLLIAIQEQLGLKLEKGKGPVEIIVIDRVEKASDN